MDEPIFDSTLSGLVWLREELQDELQSLVEKRSGLEEVLRATAEEIKSAQGVLELVEATERQLRGQGRGLPDGEGDGPGSSTQVRGSAKKLKVVCPS
jgi:hypothetical protein